MDTVRVSVIAVAVTVAVSVSVSVSVRVTISERHVGRRYAAVIKSRESRHRRAIWDGAISQRTCRLDDIPTKKCTIGGTPDS